MIHQNKYSSDYLYLFILSITTIYIWYPLTHLVLQWESYTYLRSSAYLPLFTNTWASFANFDVQSMLFGAVLSKLFGPNMPLYFWVEVFSILIINVCLYFLTRTLTKNSTSAFIASFIFAVYFFGTEFFAPNYYATFLQRVILNVPLLLVSFLFLHHFLEKRKIKNFAISLVLFFLSIFIAHFGILLTFPILLYPIFWEFISSFRRRSFLSGLFISAPYVLMVIFFLLIQKLWGENLAPKQNIFYFLTHPSTYHYVEGVVRQLVYMSQYPTVINAIRSGLYPFAFSDPTSTYKFAAPIIITYCISFIVIWKKNKKYRALLLTIVTSLIISLIINIYLNRFDFLNAAGLNRYYYYPSFFLAIFWSLVLTEMIPARRFFIIGSILFGFFFVNAALFRQYFLDLSRYGLPTKKLYEYIVGNYMKLPRNSLVIVGPTPDFSPYDATFFTEQVGKKRDIIFKTENKAYSNWEPLASASAIVLNLQYDEACACVRKEILK